MRQYLLGIDSGNTACKVTLFDESGNVVSTASTKIPTTYPKEGHSERDPEVLWRRTASIIRKTIAQTPVKAEEIAAVGICGHGNGVYLLDRSLRPLRGIQSVDTRAADICRDWEKKNLINAVYPLTFQHFWPAQTNALLAWFGQYEPVTFERCGKILLSKDYLNYRLTDEIATDYSDISVTNLFDNNLKQYSRSLLGLYGLEEVFEKLPPVCRSTEVIGTVTRSAAHQTGLHAGTPVAAGMIDASANMVGSGVTAPGRLSVIAGTWSVNSVVTRTPPDALELAMTGLFTDPSFYVAIEASATSLTNLEWFVNQFCQAEKRQAGRRGISVFELCDQMVAAGSQAESDVVYLPFLHGANHHLKARAGFLGLNGNHSKTTMLRALYEGIVCSHRMHIENLMKAGVDFEGVRLSGGASRSPVFGQLFADMLNQSIEVPVLTEAGTWGAAFAAGISVGIFNSYDEMQAPLRTTYEPKSADIEKWERVYSRYSSLLKSLGDYWT